MQPRSFIQVTPSFSRKGRLRDTASRTATSLTGAGSSAWTAAIMEQRQNRVRKNTRLNDVSPLVLPGIAAVTRCGERPGSDRSSEVKTGRSRDCGRRIWIVLDGRL